MECKQKGGETEDKEEKQDGDEDEDMDEEDKDEEDSDDSDKYDDGQNWPSKVFHYENYFGHVFDSAKHRICEFITCVISSCFNKL